MGRTRQAVRYAKADTRFFDCKTQAEGLRRGGVGGRSSPAKARRERACVSTLSTHERSEVRSIFFQSAFHRNAQTTSQRYIDKAEISGLDKLLT